MEKEDGQGRRPRSGDWKCWGPDQARVKGYVQLLINLPVNYETYCCSDSYVVVSNFTDCCNYGVFAAAALSPLFLV